MTRHFLSLGRGAIMVSVTALMGVRAGRGTEPAPGGRQVTQEPTPAAKSQEPPLAEPVGKSSAVATIRREAEALRPLVKSTIAQRFLAAAAELPSIPKRTVYHDESKTKYFSAKEANALPESERAVLKSRELDEEFYYTTRYGTPVAYARALDLVGENGFGDVSGKRILDFGYGAVGHLRMLASLGAHVVGVEVDPLLRALYSEPTDQGEIANLAGWPGSLKLVHGRFPSEARLAVGEDFELIISKNVLKNGYIHPAEPVDPKKLVQLGIDDETFVRMFFRVLKPGGRVMIYNLCPAPAPPGQPYIPWADGRCPFPKELWEKVGFRVLAFDVNDDEAARAMARALGWDKGEGAMDVEKDLFALYTLVERKVTH